MGITRDPLPGALGWAGGGVVIGPSFAAVRAAAANGDDDAFATLWHDLQPALLGYLRVVVAASAEDVASETWLEIVRGLGRFAGDEARFRAWVFTIARHRALDWQRRATRQRAVPVPVELLAARRAPDDPAAAVVEALSTQAALGWIARLPRPQAEVVVLRAVAGFDVAEVARIVGRRPGAVRALAHRGLRRLAERLAAGAGWTAL
jgi:RNA polymerase sigma-70 factor (ECF subfamily)